MESKHSSAEEKHCEEKNRDPECKSSDADVIHVTGIEFHDETNLCNLEDGLDFTVKFSCLKAIQAAKWTIKYLVDSIRKRNIIQLGETTLSDYDAGPCEFHFKVANVDISQIETSSLSNCGLLICTLESEDSGELVDLKMVVQVQVDATSGKYKRAIFSPLE